MFSTSFNLQRPMKSHHLCNFAPLRDKSSDGPTPNILSSLSLSQHTQKKKAPASKSKRRRNLERVTSKFQTLMAEINSESEPLLNREQDEEPPQEQDDVVASGGKETTTTRIASLDVFRGLCVFVKLSSLLSFFDLFCNRKSAFFLFVYLILIVKLTINVKFLLEVCLD